jgi:tRNA A37 threonylcarbamoyladenosine synthetase subunit TsaC/SUA5/YrdC
MAVTSANKHGQPSAMTAQDAREQLGYSVSVYLDGGRCADSTASTIVDVTGDVPRMLRSGAISLEKLRGVAPGTQDVGES